MRLAEARWSRTASEHVVAGATGRRDVPAGPYRLAGRRAPVWPGRAGARRADARAHQDRRLPTAPADKKTCPGREGVPAGVASLSGFGTRLVVAGPVAPFFHTARGR